MSSDTPFPFIRRNPRPVLHTARTPRAGSRRPSPRSSAGTCSASAGGQPLRGPLADHRAGGDPLRDLGAGGPLGRVVSTPDG